MEKKIIGYKCPIDLFGGNVKKGDVFINSSKNPNEYFERGSLHNIRYLPAEIVEQWELVYEQEQYKVGEWLYFEDFEFYGIFRFNSLRELSGYKTNEYYQIIDNDLYQGESQHISSSRAVTKATDQQILDVLTKVAIHKGFKDGVRFKSAWSKKRNCINEKEFSLTSNGLCNYDLLIYSNLNRKWATILPEKLELPAGYVDNGDKTITTPDNAIFHYEWYRGANSVTNIFKEVVAYINENK